MTKTGSISSKPYFSWPHNDKLASARHECMGSGVASDLEENPPIILFCVQFKRKRSAGGISKSDRFLIYQE